MDGNSVTDDRSLLLDQLATLRDKVDGLRKHVVETDWRISTVPTLETAFRQLNLAGEFILDVTGELLRFQRERAEWREVAEVVFESTPYPLLLTHGDSRIEHANDAAGVLFNMPPERLQQRSLTDLFEPDDLPDLASELRRTADGIAGDDIHIEPQLAATTGLDDLRLDVQITPLGHETPAETPPRYLWLVRDPSDTNHIELRLQSLQKNAALGRMATGITHEFKNILGIITTWCELGLRNEDCPDSVRTALRKISHASNRGTTLTESILAYGQHDESESTTLDINALLSDNLETLGALLPGRVQVDLALAEDSLMATFDRDHFEQILLNLVLNARDAISGSGTITCRSRSITIDGEGRPTQHTRLSPGDYVEIDIADTGCGMDSETLQEASAPFYSTKQEDGGTGLGLPTVIDLVSRADGGVIIDSEPEEGTTVRVLLPRTDGS